MANTEGDQQLAGALHAILDKIELIYFKLQRSGIGNESSFIKDTFSERFQLQMPVLHQSTCTFNASLWSLGKIYNVPTKILKRDARTNSS